MHQNFAEEEKLKEKKSNRMFVLKAQSMCKQTSDPRLDPCRPMRTAKTQITGQKRFNVISCVFQSCRV